MFAQIAFEHPLSLTLSITVVVVVCGVFSFIIFSASAACLYSRMWACMCPATYPYSSVVCSFSVVSLDLSRCAIVSYENRNSFNYFYLVFIPFVSFSCPSALMNNTSSTSDGVFFLSSEECPQAAYSHSLI